MTNRINATASIDRPSKIYHPDTSRQCQHEDCKIRLSKYNPTTYCSTHERYSLPAAKVI